MPKSIYSDTAVEVVETKVPLLWMLYSVSTYDRQSQLVEFLQLFGSLKPLVTSAYLFLPNRSIHLKDNNLNIIVTLYLQRVNTRLIYKLPTTKLWKEIQWNKICTNQICTNYRKKSVLIM